MLNLDEVRDRILEFCDRRQDKGGPYGAYRMHEGQRTDLYSSCDLAIARAVTGEDFGESLTDEERRQWAGHINSYCIDRGKWQGIYTDPFKGHSQHHANGMVIGALGPIGGKQPSPVPLYRDIDTPDKAVAWLEGIDWSRQWGSSHLFWGAAHCFSMSKACSDAWREAVFDWLDANVDETTGWWRKGAGHSDRHQALGGSAHILPIYEHHGRPFPYPERVIDSVLDLQLPDGTWLDREGLDNPAHYLELDALYALAFMMKLAPGYRKDDIRAAVSHYADTLEAHWRAKGGNYFKPQSHAHSLLALAGCMGLCFQHDPERFPASTSWTDIFSDIRLYRTDLVETLEDKA